MVSKDKSWISPKHLKITVFAGILFLICACVNTGMTNTILPAICELRGWEYSDVLPFMSYGGYIGAAATLLFAQLTVKKGPKFIIIMGLIFGGLSLILYGFTTILALFVLAVIGNRVFSCAYQQSGGTVLLNNWFPKKKGIVLGWATMGIILSDVLWSPYIPKALSAIGVSKTMGIVGTIFFALAIYTLFCIKNYPEEDGCSPDNDSESVEKIDIVIESNNVYQSSFNWKRLFRTRQVWQIGITWGLLWMIAIAFVSQVVGRCISIGYEMYFAIRILQIASIVGLFGSWLFGYIDTKFGSKTASTVYAVVIAVFFLIGILQRFGVVFVWISACGIMACVGGIANLAPSMIGTVFGRWDFAAANRLISPVIMSVSSSAFILVSIFLKSPWGYDGMYIACTIIAVLCLFSVRLTNDKMIGTVSQEKDK